MLSIDSQILIYYFDPHSKEYANIVKWFEEILVSEEIFLSAIVPIEVAQI